MTWVAITEDSILDGTEADEPGAVMLNLMRSHPSEVSYNLIGWIFSRRSRTTSLVRSLLDPSEADRLKEEFLQYVADYVAEVGYYSVWDNGIEIREVAEDVES